MEAGTVIALLAIVVSVLGLLLNSRKETRTDAAESARMEAKLDAIGRGVDDIRVEFRAMRDRVDGLAQRVSALEGRVNALAKEE